eukprot:317977-Chlamydomonas_euryale.AAC.2
MTLFLHDVTSSKASVASSCSHMRKRAVASNAPASGAACPSQRPLGVSLHRRYTGGTHAALCMHLAALPSTLLWPCCRSEPSGAAPTPPSLFPPPPLPLPSLYLRRPLLQRRMPQCRSFAASLACQTTIPDALQEFSARPEKKPTRQLAACMRAARPASVTGGTRL